MVIAALFKKMIVIRYCKANEAAHYCCIFDKMHGVLDVFVALQAFDFHQYTTCEYSSCNLGPVSFMMLKKSLFFHLEFKNISYTCMSDVIINVMYL